MNVTVEYLADHPDQLKNLAPYLHKEWGHHNQEASVADRIAIMQKRMNYKMIPTCFIALSSEKQCVGTVSLIENDLETRPDFFPWLATLFVLPEYHNQGVGKALIARALEEAKALSFSKLYLCTPNKESYYKNLGWTKIEATQNHGEETVIMAIEMG